MPPSELSITSLSNPRVKRAVKLRQRSHRDKEDLLLIEGYRELKRAVDNRHVPCEVFVCPELFQGSNEPALIDRCREAGAQILSCPEPVFRKMAYRDRPEGLLAVAPALHKKLTDVVLRNPPLLIVAEAIEKPGNLGTILRSADASGVDAVLVCDRCTDINNPNVVRASIGALFTLPVVEVSTPEALSWLREREIRVLAATPHADCLYTEADMTGPIAVVVGTEQVGLTGTWLSESDVQVRIPMSGQCDSLNVATATTLLLYEAVRQRGAD